jgi:hypothetical protein
VLTTDGDLVVLNRTPEKYDELRRYKVGRSETWAHPILLRDRVVIRDADSVAVLALQ